MVRSNLTVTRPKLCVSGGPDVLSEVDVLDPEKLAAADAAFGPDFKNKAYYAYNELAFYDMQVYMSPQRTPPPSAVSRDQQQNDDDCDS